MSQFVLYCRTSVVHCLSHVRFMATMLDEGTDLSDACSAQLRKAYLDTERVEGNANLELFRVCKHDIKALECYGGEKTAEDVIECLRKDKSKVVDKK